MVMTWYELVTRSPAEMLAWAEEEPWSRAMAACQQDERWHAEGDVWTHTKLVCEQLGELPDWPTLSERERAVLLFTALFHDAGKPATTQLDPQTGRVVSPKHAVKGEQIARGVLRDLQCDLPTRELIARLVRFHGRPAFLLERAEPSHEVVSLSWLADNKLLYLFALADTRGRASPETTRPEENLYLWKLVAEENNCFEHPYPFANDHARFLFFRQQPPNLHYVPFERFECSVTMLSGLPGSGKDAWLAANRADLSTVSLDDVRAELDVDAEDDQGEVVRVARERCRELLRAGRSFAFNATNLLRSTRVRWVDLFAAYEARVEMVYVEPPFHAILSQNANRQRPVPESVIRSLAAKLEPPTWAEAHRLTLVEKPSALAR